MEEMIAQNLFMRLSIGNVKPGSHLIAVNIGDLLPLMYVN